MRRVLTTSPDDEPELLAHATVALLARDLFNIRELEEYALGELKFQLRCWSSNSLFKGIQIIYTTQKKAARQLFVTEVIRSYPEPHNWLKLFRKPRGKLESLQLIWWLWEMCMAKSKIELCLRDTI